MRRRISRTPEQRQRIRKAHEDMNDNINKALIGADLLLKGEQAPNLSSGDYEQAMLSYFESQQLGDESSAQAFSRLIDEGDDIVNKLWAATDVARIEAYHGSVIRKRAVRGQAVDLIKKAEDLVGDYASSNKRADETIEAAHARLAVGDDMYKRLYAHYAECQDLL